MKTDALPQTPLSLDAQRCLGLFDRYGRRRAGRGLRRCALVVLANDPGFDLWTGLAELADRQLVTELDGGNRWVLTEAGADRLRYLFGGAAQAARSAESPRPPAGVRGIAA